MNNLRFKCAGREVWVDADGDVVKHSIDYANADLCSQPYIALVTDEKEEIIWLGDMSSDRWGCSDIENCGDYAKEHLVSKLKDLLA